MSEETAPRGIPAVGKVVFGPPPESKPARSDTVRRELDRVARQLEGMSKAVKRLKEAV